ncbi:MAG: hypothetical protein HYV07_21575 [Deltaproteobacteria bacterium]|nr:hypothetical protein [Deltaproteobacteria bacterium]
MGHPDRDIEWWKQTFRAFVAITQRPLIGVHGFDWLVNHRDAETHIVQAREAFANGHKPDQPRRAYVPTTGRIE